MEFKPFDKVLVRRGENEWVCAIYSHYAGDDNHWVIGECCPYKQILPYEGNEHLLGTTDSQEPEFKFGDKVEVSENGTDWYKAIYFHKTDVLDLFPHVVMRDNGRRHELFKHCRKADW